MDLPLRKTLADVVRWLRENYVDHALIGALAISARGNPRATADVDLVVAIDTQRALDLVAALESSDFQPLFTNVQDVVEQAFILPLLHRETKVKVDLSIGLSRFEQRAVARADVQNVLGTQVPVATAEDLIIMKSLAGRPQDEQDIRGLAMTLGEQLDWEYCERTATDLGEAIGVDLRARVRLLREGK